MVNDPVADYIIQLKNAAMSGRTGVSVPYSKLLHSIARVLEKRGYVANVEKKGRKEKKTLEVSIVYSEDQSPRITDVRRMSKPSRRIYLGAKELRPVRNGKGALILSTPSGILADEEAREKNVGGEALFKIW